MKRIAPLSVIGCLGLLFAASACFAQTITTFDAPDSSATLPMAINPRGQIVGSYVSATPDQHFGYRALGFLREPDGTIKVIDARPVYSRYVNTYPTAINSGGRVTGEAVDMECGDCARAFLRENDGTLTLFQGSSNVESASRLSFQNAFQFPGGFSTDKVPFYIRGGTGTGINAAGQIVGVHVELNAEGFLRQRDGTVIDFDVLTANVPPFMAPQTVPQAINESGQITGYASAGGVTYHGFVGERNGTIVTFDALDSTATYAQAINQLGEITGSYTTGIGGFHGFLRSSDGTIITFDPPGSLATEAHGINVEGQIVGSYLGSDGIFHSFIRERNGRVTTFDVSGTGIFGTFARDINPQGEITGYYTDMSGTHGFVRSPDR